MDDRGRIYLRAMRTEDSWLMYRWHNDVRVMEGMMPPEEPFPPSMERVRRILEKAILSCMERYFIIETGQGRAVGFTSLTSIDPRAASARLVVVIGEIDEWGKGLGREATEWMMNYAFDVLNLHRVHVQVPDCNTRAIACFLSCGFLPEGTLRDDHYHAGAYRSSHVMSALRDEASI